MLAPALLPTFFVIGAPKCATTSLHAYLDRHSSISMSSVKEPFIFAGEDWRARLAEYEALLSPQAPVRGESSTVYTQYPHFGDVSARIADAVPDALFIYLVRDPIDRAVAHYSQHVADGKEARPLAQALADHAAPGSTYLAASRYATQLRLYLRRFPPERFLVADQVDLRDRPEQLLARVFGFLGVRDEPAAAAAGLNLNPADELRVRTGLGRLLADRSVMELARRLPLPGPLRRRARAAIARPLPEQELDPGLRAALADELREEVEWLREFTGEQFPGWSL